MNIKELLIKPAHPTEYTDVSLIKRKGQEGRRRRQKLSSFSVSANSFPQIIYSENFPGSPRNFPGLVPENWIHTEHLSSPIDTTNSSDSKNFYLLFITKVNFLSLSDTFQCETAAPRFGFVFLFDTVGTKPESVCSHQSFHYVSYGLLSSVSRFIAIVVVQNSRLD